MNKRIIRKIFSYFLSLIGFTLIFIVLTTFSLITLSSLWEQKASCDFYGSRGVIEETCTAYSSNQVGGSLCEDLCDKQLITYVGCVNHKLGRSILFMNYTKPGKEPKTVVLKIQRYPDGMGRFLKDIDIDDEHDSDKVIMEKMEKNILPIISKQLGQSFNQLNASVLSQLWGYNFTSYVRSFKNKTAAVRSALRSIWFVVQQREYVLMRLSQHMQAIPRMYGTCGAVFVMEYARAIGGLKTGFLEGRGLAIHLTPWKPRAKYAVKILEMVPSLDTDFSEPLYLCDLKDPNIGMRGDGNISLIDLDHGTFKSELTEMFREQNCSEDLNCGLFYNCPGHCDTNVRKCTGEITNNNLQAVCERVFLNKVGWINTGLLRGPPPAIEEELMNLVHHCAFPPSGISPIALDRGFINKIKGHTRRVVHKPGDDIRKELIKVIKRGISL